VREVGRARAAGASRELALPEPLSVHLVYFTAEADADGALRFHPDVYGRDAPLEAALSGADPAGVVAGEARPCAAAPLSPASSP
jgi:murein L,D-transpeptidase YcbB/YkuD